MNITGRLFVVSAPSGAGKSTLVNKVCLRLGKQCSLERVVTYTSRAPRQEEIDGKDYHFLSEEAFKLKAQEGFFIEWSTDYGNYYGSPSSIIEEMAQGRSYMMIMDRAGSRVIKDLVKNAVLVWITVKDLNALFVRLQTRKTENNVEINKRLVLAEQEIEDECNNSFFDYHLLNDDLETALLELEKIVLLETKLK